MKRSIILLLFVLAVTGYAQYATPDSETVAVLRAHVKLLQAKVTKQEAQIRDLQNQLKKAGTPIAAQKKTPDRPVNIGRVMAYAFNQAALAASAAEYPNVRMVLVKTAREELRAKLKQGPITLTFSVLDVKAVDGLVHLSVSHSTEMLAVLKAFTKYRHRIPITAKTHNRTFIFKMPIKQAMKIQKGARLVLKGKAVPYFKWPVPARVLFVLAKHGYASSYRATKSDPTEIVPVLLMDTIEFTLNGTKVNTIHETIAEAQIDMIE